MIKHYIILSSSYSQGIRIALHSSFQKELESTYIVETLRKIKEACGEEVSISTHYIVTDSDSWESVCQKDPFFENIQVIGDVETFIRLIQIDLKLVGLDIAKYILSKYRCTHLKLEKLVYLCYADYLVQYDKKMFDDTIYAFQYGPVVRSVYEKYKGIQTEEDMLQQEPLDADPLNDFFLHMPARSRLLFATDGIQKINSINKTLDKYGEYTARQLVDLTHKKGTPWERTYKKTAYKKIDDAVIKNYHFVET